MDAAPARYYDGITPLPREVSLSIAGPMLLIRDAAGAELARWLISDLRVPGQDSTVGEAMIHSRAQPDARLVVADRRTVDGLSPHLPLLEAVIRPRRSSLRVWTLVTILAAAVLGGFAVALWRGPELLAPLVPRSWETSAGDFILDKMVARYSTCTAPDGSAALATLTDRLVAASGYKDDLKIVVVDAKLVNAFALPGGRMVLFNGLIQEAATPDEVAGVFAHELGHVVHRHPMRSLIRQLGLGFVRRLALGNYGEAVDSAAGFGEMVLALRNGRAAEREADAAALAYLAAAGLRQDGLHEFFARLAEKGDAGEELGILSTHPPLKERSQSTQRSGDGDPALDHGQWQALRKICSQPAGAAKPRPGEKI